MQNSKKVVILASILLAACATDPIQESTDTVVTPEETVAAKICNTSQSAIKGMIIAKFNDEVIPVLEQAVAQQAATRSQVTRSGIESVDDIFQNLDVTSFERVFPEAGEMREALRTVRRIAAEAECIVLGIEPEEDDPGDGRLRIL